MTDQTSERPKFKKGDFVLCLQTLYGCKRNHLKGSRFTVTGVHRHDPAGLRITLKGEGARPGDSFDASLFELVEELNNIDYLRDLSDRLGCVPVMHGVDQYDMERLRKLARRLEALNG